MLYAATQNVISLGHLLKTRLKVERLFHISHNVSADWRARFKSNGLRNDIFERIQGILEMLCFLLNGYRSCVGLSWRLMSYWWCEERTGTVRSQQQWHNNRNNGRRLAENIHQRRIFSREETFLLWPLSQTGILWVFVFINLCPNMPSLANDSLRRPSEHFY